MLNEALAMLRGDSDVFAIAEMVERDRPTSGDLSIAKRYAELITDLYWKAKEVTALTTLGQLGAHFCLSRANDAAPEEANQLRGLAKQIAFNTGSFAWPGWAEPGVTITESDLKVGRVATKLNLRLAIELNRPAKAMSNAYWLIGAYAIVDRQAESAVAAFDRAAQYSEEAADPTAAAMNRAYAVLARLVEQPQSTTRNTEFGDALTAIESTKSEDAAFFLQQLKTARGVFA